ncbi:MAG TPA: glycosyl hydrolase [Cytophagales bacterium]|nr:glycosyl hydrolase [Cytophagales bacterium]HRG07701.1 glycosyl hydrolase [Cyclobacteriaceae bacterium]
MRKFTTLILLVLSIAAGAQTSVTDWEASYKARKQKEDQSILKDYPVRNIGPTVQGGRIVDIEVNLKDTKEFYVGYGSGGIFKTLNNGITFEPIFDNVDALGIGDFALSQSDPKIIYVGTGEKNGSRSTYAGSGVYKTVDGGKSWTNLGLAGTHHVSRILIHPQDNNTVWVASLGALYSNNADRGVFKSTDGGKTWKKTLYINDSTGVSDLIINPQNPKQLLAATWERTRKAWDFKGNGSGSAIYRSEDGGDTWTLSAEGFPKGKFVGRIGLDGCWTKPNVIYAVLDNQEEVREEKKESPKAKDDKLKLADLKDMSVENFLKLDDKKLDELLKESRFPAKYTSQLVKKEIRSGKYKPQALAEYFGTDANSDLFNTKIKGAEVYRSDDAGKSWKRTHTADIDGVYFTYGYYFGELRVSPSNTEDVYIYGVPMLKSEDGGKNWVEIDSLGTMHSDHHALWINPNDDKHILMGNDGGLYQSYDKGDTWLHYNNVAAGQFYTVNVDFETPYNVYGGLQDNGVLRGSSRSVPNRSKHWEAIFGGDGMYVAPDPRNNKLVYTGFQFGNYFKLELDRGRNTRITPSHAIGEAPNRWNWRTPLILSKHNPDIVYMASQRVYRSLNKAESWESISGDLTKNKKQGNVPFSSIASLAESPVKFGLLYVGTDDGNAWVSKNGGGSWESIATGLPTDKWVSSISPSPHDEATVFVSLNGYRTDDFKTYVFMSSDYGKTWTSVKGNLPESVANVIIQDPVNANLFYCGLDNGTYVSLDAGKSWQLLNKALNVASYDMMVHPRDNELIVGTHGRSVFVADVKPLQALKDASKAIVAYANDGIRYSERWGQKSYSWSTAYEPSTSMLYYVGKPTTTISVEILDEKNNVVRTLSTTGAAGFHSVNWDLKINEVAAAPAKVKTKPAPTTTALKYAGKGKYKIKFINGTESSETTFEVK